MIVNGDEFENIELRKASDVGTPGQRVSNQRPTQQPSNRQLDNNDNAKNAEFMELSRNIANLTHGHSSDSDRTRELSSGYGSESGDMLREFVKNKELMRTSARKKDLPRYSSVDSDASEGSTLVSTSSELGDRKLAVNRRRSRARISHQQIGSPVSDSEAESIAVSLCLTPACFDVCAGTMGLLLLARLLFIQPSSNLHGLTGHVPIRAYLL